MELILFMQRVLFLDVDVKVLGLSLVTCSLAFSTVAMLEKEAV